VLSGNLSFQSVNKFHPIESHDPRHLRSRQGLMLGEASRIEATWSLPSWRKRLLLFPWLQGILDFPMPVLRNYYEGLQWYLREYVLIPGAASEIEGQRRALSLSWCYTSSLSTKLLTNTSPTNKNMEVLLANNAPCISFHFCVLY